MCPSLSKKNIIKNHLNRLKQGEGLLKIFAITKLKTYYGNALSCVTGLRLENYPHIRKHGAIESIGFLKTGKDFRDSLRHSIHRFKLIYDELMIHSNLELKDENLPFEKSVFASAVKKSLQDGISKI